MDRIGVQKFADAAGNGTPCYTLGVRGDAATVPSSRPKNASPSTRSETPNEGGRLDSLPGARLTRHDGVRTFHTARRATKLE
jgi:hypothetical protein